MFENAPLIVRQYLELDPAVYTAPIRMVVHRLGAVCGHIFLTTFSMISCYKIRQDYHKFENDTRL